MEQILFNQTFTGLEENIVKQNILLFSSKQVIINSLKEKPYMSKNYFYNIEVDSKIFDKGYNFKNLSILSAIRIVVLYLLDIDGVGLDGASIIITKHLQK